MIAKPTKPRHLLSDRDTTVVISDTNTRPTSHIEDTAHSDSSVENRNTDASSRSSDLDESAVSDLTRELLAKSDKSLQDIVALQRMDTYIRPILDYLEDDRLPRSQKLSRRILLQASDYIVSNNILLHRKVAKSKRVQGHTPYQVVVPESLVQTVIQIYHETPMSAHGGITDTLDRVKEHYFFPRMATRVGDYVKSCHDCQARKMTKVPTKAGIVSYPTPMKTFEALQVDLLGPLPLSYKGNVHVFTATCMLSKFIYAVPIPNKDAITVSEAMYSLFTTFGVCDTILSDHGSENIAAVTREVCKRMGIAQQFTPSFTHHCLGSCERVHKTLEERLTPYVDAKRRDWDVHLSSVVFAINQSVNSSTGYSPFEVIFGCRPKFPLLAEEATSDLTGQPVDVQEYVRNFLQRLDVVRQQVRQNVEKSKTNMVNRANAQSQVLHLTAGDYVYLTSTPSGTGQKLQPKYSGPHVVQSVLSDHRVFLMDKDGKPVSEDPVHINRLKMAYVRQPSPLPYLMGPVTTRKDLQPKVSDHSTQTDEIHIATPPEQHSPDVQTETVSAESDQQPLSPDTLPKRPVRTRRKPLRFRDSDHISSLTSGCFDSGQYYKVKRVIGQRIQNNKTSYLVQFSGEPAQNAMWISWEDLSPKAKRVVKSKPPPILQ